MRRSPRRGSLRRADGVGARDVGRAVVGVAVLVALSQAGDWAVLALGAPVPGSVVGMLALTALLELKVLPVSLMRPAAELLVRHLALLYVPAGVAVIAYVAVVRHDLVAITVAALASLVAVLLTVGLVVQRWAREP
jgi:holin-like protein